MVKPLSLAFLGFLCVFCTCHRPAPNSLAEGMKDSHRSPGDVILLSPTRALTANFSTGTVSLVDLEKGKVLAEIAVGKRPEALALSPDKKQVVAANLWSHSLTVLRVGENRLEVSDHIPVGAYPRGVVFSPEGRHVYVALAGEDAVVKVDLETHKKEQRFPAEREPRALALSADGRYLAAACSKSAQVRCWDLSTGKQLWERTNFDGFNFRGLVWAPDQQSVIVSHVVRRDFPVTKNNIDSGWVIDSRLTKFALQGDAIPAYWQIALDARGQAVGDPHALAFSPDQSLLVLSAGGTQELLVLQNAHIPWTPGSPGDFIDFILEDGKKLRRIPLGGRPLGMQFLGERKMVVANYLLDALQIVDLTEEKIEKTIHLGGPKEPGLVRKGEALFYDARRSHNQWFSCHTCHVDGHTNGQTFDTLNDNAYGAAKLTPSLRNVTKTAPWTWIGWQKDLGAAVKKSYTETMFGPEPSKEDIQAVVAFLDTLGSAPHPRQGSFSLEMKRGKALFEGKANCVKCHRGEYLTSPATYDVKIGFDTDFQKYFNPPSLRGLHDRWPYLHDGRAQSLEDLLRRHHTAEMVGGEKISDQERQDLIEYLKSL